MDHGKKQIKFMSYNVWRREDVTLYRRMKAIGGLVQSHNPDVIFFQEVTPDIRDIFEGFTWWNEYRCASAGTEDHQLLLLSKIPLSYAERRGFACSPTHRCFLTADTIPPPASASPPPIRLATAQLERPNPPSSMRFRDRYTQAQRTLSELDLCGNAVFGGDMSWDDCSDRPFPLPAGWVDAWTVLRGTTDFYDSWTYDAFWEVNAMKFNGYVARYDSMKKRSDRFVCKLTDYKPSKIELIGDDAIGPTTYNTKPANQGITRDLKPSCHRGLVLTIIPNEPPPLPEASQGSGAAEAAGNQ